MNNNKIISILGSTGSVGQQTVEVAAALNVRVAALAAFSDVYTMEKQARLLMPEVCVMKNENSAKDLKVKLADTSIKVYGGYEALLEASRGYGADIVFNSIGGSAGFEPTMAALDEGKTLALANKESIVMAGTLVMKKAKENNSLIIPVDSEHSAVFQCLQNGARSVDEVSRIILTASGGPFFNMNQAELKTITPERALAHPTWKMGKKITIDSATLMNKGFEVIEAVHLFGLSANKVDVVIHRESIIHSMVEYNDNAILAQLSLPDMRLCAQYAMTYPQRCSGIMERLDLTKLGTLSFFKPDMKAFPLLKLAYDSISKGALLVGADEAAVEAFLDKKISFTDINNVVIKTVYDLPSPADNIEDIRASSAEAYKYANDLINNHRF